MVKLQIVNQRLVVNSMEPRGAICEYDAKDDRSTLWVSSQGVSMIRPVVADMILKIGSPKLRVRTGDVGGGFGMKIFVHPEYPMVVWASRTLKRTVKWIPDRQEAFQSDVQGRDHVSIAEMALDKDARFIGCRITTYAALGAYLSHFSAFIPTLAGSSMLVGLYQTPAIYVNVKGVMTNTVPTDAYRGAGRPEAAYLLERFVDHIARETGLAPDEIRARNFIKPGQIPWKTALGDTYDSRRLRDRHAQGHGEGRLEGLRRPVAPPPPPRASGAASAWRPMSRNAAAAARPRRRSPSSTTTTRSRSISATRPTARATRRRSRQIASARLGIDAERIRIVQGDTRRRARGHDRRQPHGRRWPARRRWASPTRSSPRASWWRRASWRRAPPTSTMRDGAFKIVGTDRTMSLFDVAKAAKDPKHVPKGEKPGLDDEFTRTPDADTFPNGCHICELEIDPDTGTLEILNYSVMDDFGSGAESAAAAGPGPWRRRPGRGPGADREDGLRQGLGPAPERQLHGLRLAARRHRAARATSTCTTARARPIRWA